MAYARSIIAIIAAIGITVAQAGYIVKPERATEVVMSNIDVNRIVCDSGKISDIFYSEEKGVVVTSSGRDAFVKVKMKRKVGSGELIRPVLNIDLHVVCDGSVYTIIGALKPVPSQTIRLKSASRNIKENIKILGAMPEEKRLQWIIRAAYKNDYPDSFIVKDVNRPFGDAGSVYLDIKRTIRIDGLGLKLTEYEATASVSTMIHESLFLQPEFGKHIVAVSLDMERMKLDAGQKFRVFVIEKVGN